MLTRREFILRTFEYGGFGALAMMGLEREAQAWGIMPMTMGGAANWDGWKEKSESGIASSDTAIWFLENTIAGGGETGLGGGLTGNDRIGTQAGNLAGATGTPPSRVFDETDDDMTFTSAALSIPGSSWSIIIKAEDMKDYAPARTTYPFYSDSADSWIFYRRDNNSTSIKLNGVDILTGVFATEVSDTGIVYVCIWCDGTYVRAGWKATTKPTKWSDFPANNRISATSACDFSAETMDAGEGLYHSGSSGICEIYYIVISKECLINNNA